MLADVVDVGFAPHTNDVWAAALVFCLPHQHNFDGCFDGCIDLTAAVGSAAAVVGGADMCFSCRRRRGVSVISRGGVG